MNEHNLPFQVTALIENLLNKNERPHIRENYRMRLEIIRDAIDQSIKKYNNENWITTVSKKKSR
jgi:metal-responsive CopG/Arc/MetJ family transcriptional regulator